MASWRSESRTRTEPVVWQPVSEQRFARLWDVGIQLAKLRGLRATLSHLWLRSCAVAINACSPSFTSIIETPGAVLIQG